MNGTGSPSKMAVVLNESNDLILRRSQWDKAKDAFTDFCRSTSLHGWQHLTETPHLSRGVPHGSGKYMWILIVVASIGVASFFLFTSILDFTSKYVVTNIDTTTAPLNVSCRFKLMKPNSFVLFILRTHRLDISNSIRIYDFKMKLVSISLVNWRLRGNYIELHHKPLISLLESTISLLLNVLCK